MPGTSSKGLAELRHWLKGRQGLVLSQEVWVSHVHQWAGQGLVLLQEVWVSHVH